MAHETTLQAGDHPSDAAFAACRAAWAHCDKAAGGWQDLTSAGARSSTQQAHTAPAASMRAPELEGAAPDRAPEPAVTPQEARPHAIRSVCDGFWKDGGRIAPTFFCSCLVQEIPSLMTAKAIKLILLVRPTSD